MAKWRGNPPRQTAYGLYNMLDFGKHYGQRIGEVIAEDPEYLAWCLDTIRGFELTEEAEKELDEALEI